MMIVNDCKVKENANDEDAMIVVNHEVPNSPTQKCLFACFYETLGVVSQILSIENKVVHTLLVLKSYHMAFIHRLKEIRCQ